jgi:ubiquitin C-terminal hydrolase
MKINFFFIIALFVSLTLQAWPPALQNCGNTCFLNASIQVLYHIPPLTKLLETQGNNPYPDNSASFFYWNLIKKFEETQNPNNPSIFTCEPQLGLGKLDKSSFELMEFSCGSQQDATEFMWKFLDQLIEKNNELKSMIEVLFKFNLMSSIKCPALPNLVEYESITKDPALHLTLETKKNNTIYSSLNDCLDNFFSFEKLDDPQNFYNDPRTNQPRSDCTKKLSIETSPEILMIGLKRFEFITATHSNKLDHSIQIPFTLDMASFVKNSRQENTYELIGAVIQGGGIKSGHYWAYVQDLSGQWYKCDDASITKVSATGDSMLEEINGAPNKPTGYLFVYQKTSSRKKSHAEYEEMQKEAEKKEQKQIALASLSTSLNNLTNALTTLQKSLGGK